MRERCDPRFVVICATLLQIHVWQAANVLGLSKQAPTRVVFLTDEPTRHVKIGQREIILKRATPRNMATAGRKSGTIIQVLRHIGRRNVDDRTIAIINRNLTSADRDRLGKD